MRPSLFSALRGVELILHAGDVGGQDVLDELSSIAPTLAVFGNTDPPGMPGLEHEIVHKVGPLTIHVSHGHELGSPTAEKLLIAYKEDVLVYGHTHRPEIRQEGRRLVVNPGGAGPRRFHLRPSVALLTISGETAHAEIVHLEP